MPLRKFASPIAARAVQITSFDDYVAEYTLGTDCFVRGVQLTARPTAGVPTTAQLQGVTRIIAYRGLALDPVTDHMSLFASAPAAAQPFLDGNFGMANLSGPTAIWCTPTFVERGESFALQVCRGIAADGSGMDVDVVMIPIVDVVRRASDTQGLVAV